jgi:hypothetical protein
MGFARSERKYHWTQIEVVDDAMRRLRSASVPACPRSSFSGLGPVLCRCAAREYSPGGDTLCGFPDGEAGDRPFFGADIKSMTGVGPDGRIGQNATVSDDEGHRRDFYVAAHGKSIRVHSPGSIIVAPSFEMPESAIVAPDRDAVRDVIHVFNDRCTVALSP